MNQEININLNNIELLAPLISASLINAVQIQELISIQKKDGTFNRNEAAKEMLTRWLSLSAEIQNLPTKTKRQP